MTCPRCFAEFDPAPGACPKCGVKLLRNLSGMLKTSAVLISTDGEHGFYRSVQDVPEPLRQKLLRVTASENSGTIVIADRAGKEQLTQVVARQESAQEAVLAAPQETRQKESTRQPESKTGRLPGTSPAPSRPRFSWVVWAGAFLLLGSAGVIAAAFTIHW